MKKIVSIIICLAALALFTSDSHADMLQIKGSDTLINLVQRLAEVYMEKNPGKFIAVTGGGSGTGIAALINKKCDIANSSRGIKDKEVAQAMQNGVSPKRFVAALDGITFVVNQNNPVTQLTTEELGKIFRGEVTNYSEVGGNDMSISLYGRQSNSGTYAFVQEEICKGNYSPKMKQMNGTSQIVEAVKSDLSGIGYVGVGYAKEAAGVTAVKVAAKAGGTYADPLDPADIESGVYPVTRPLNQYVDGMPAGDTKDFLAFEASPEGQKIVEEMGFVALPDEYKEFNKQVGL